jgi:F0F1-type ATP synthase epsilon subunit
VIEAVTVDGNREVMAVSGGFIEVLAGKVVILADTAERASELDEHALSKPNSAPKRLRSKLSIRTMLILPA